MFTTTKEIEFMDNRVPYYDILFRKFSHRKQDMGRLFKIIKKKMYRDNRKIALSEISNCDDRVYGIGIYWDCFRLKAKVAVLFLSGESKGLELLLSVNKSESVIQGTERHQELGTMLDPLFELFDERIKFVEEKRRSLSVSLKQNL